MRFCKWLTVWIINFNELGRRYSLQRRPRLRKIMKFLFPLVAPPGKSLNLVENAKIWYELIEILNMNRALGYPFLRISGSIFSVKATWNRETDKMVLIFFNLFAQFLSVKENIRILWAVNKKLQIYSALDNSLLQTWLAIFFMEPTSERKCHKILFNPLRLLRAIIESGVEDENFT